MSVPTTLYDKILRIIEGPKIQTTTFFGKIKAMGQTLLRTSTFKEVQNRWITGEGAAEAVGLTLTDDDKANINNLVNQPWAKNTNENIQLFKIDEVGAYIITKLFNDMGDTLTEVEYNKLRNKAFDKTYYKISKMLRERTEENFNVTAFEGGSRYKKSKKSKKSTKTRKNKQSQRNRRRSQRNRN